MTDIIELKLLLLILMIAGISFLIVAFFLGKKIGQLSASKHLTTEIRIAREDAVKRSRAVLNGQLSEQFAAFFPVFLPIRLRSGLSESLWTLLHFRAFLPGSLMKYSLSK